MLHLNNEETNKATARLFIEKYCQDETSRQRDDLYDYLNDKLNIVIDRQVYDYNDKRIDHARFSCDQEYEVNDVIDRVVRELKKKFL